MPSASRRRVRPLPGVKAYLFLTKLPEARVGLVLAECNMQASPTRTLEREVISLQWRKTSPQLTFMMGGSNFARREAVSPCVAPALSPCWLATGAFNILKI